jgi:hypothetical protein
MFSTTCSIFQYVISNFNFAGETGVKTWLHICKVGALLLEPHLHFVLLWSFLEMEFPKLFAQDDL